MAYCKKCGNPINEGARICTACGTAVTAPPSAAPQAVSPMAYNYTISERPSVHGSKWIALLRVWAWVIFAAILLTGLIVGIAMFMQAGEMSRYWRGAGDGLVFAGFLCILVSIPIAFLTVAGIMVALDAAKDLREIKNHLKTHSFVSDNDEANASLRALLSEISGLRTDLARKEEE